MRIDTNQLLVCSHDIRTFTINDRGLKDAVATRQRAKTERKPRESEAAEKTIAERSKEIAKKKKSEGKSHLRLLNIGLAVIGLVAFVVFVVYGRFTSESGDDVRRAAAIGPPLAIASVFGLGALQIGRGGVLAYIRGKDQRLSTSLTQVALWTFAVGTAFLYFIALDALSNKPELSFEKTVGSAWKDLPEEYLLLLGGPFAAAVVARLAVGTKVDQGRLQKVDSDQTKLRDVITDDDGRGNLVDAQFLFFNVIALTWFAVAMTLQAEEGLPAIPPVLVGLTSIAALGYTASKAAESNQPFIKSVTRHLGAAGQGIRPGDLVEVRGTNFMPPGTVSEEFISQLSVRFGELDVLPEILNDDAGVVLSPTDTSLIAQVPETLGVEAPVDVSVITAAGAQSAARPIKLVPDKAVIIGPDPPGVARPGRPLVVKGRFFRSPRAAESDQPIVFFGERQAEASASLDDELTVTVPSGISAASVPLTVIAAGATERSEPMTVKVQKKRRVIRGRR